MKKILFSSLLMIITLSAGLAQSLEEILSQHEKAMGYDQLTEIKTARITGSNLRGKGGVPFTIYIKGQKIRYESDVRGQKIVQVYDGQQGWFVSPRSGEVRAMPQVLVRKLKERARLGGYLARWEEMRDYLSLVGTKEIKVNKEKMSVYRIRLDIQEVSVTDFYIDRKSYLLLRETEKTSMNGRQITRRVDYGDYRKVQGVMVAFLRKSDIEGGNPQTAGGAYDRGSGAGGGRGKGLGGGQGRGGGMVGGTQGGTPAGQIVMRLDKVEFNIPVDDHLFSRESLR